MKKKVFTGADIEALLKAGKSAADIPAGAVLTPSAKDVLRDGSAVRAGGGTPRRARRTDPSRLRVPLDSRQGPEDAGGNRGVLPLPAIVAIKQRMVDIGKRMWAREYTDGNGGNLTIRVGDNLVLCTPTLVSKGFMTMEQMCLVDMEGKQLAGKYKRTSECMTHLAIMKRQPKCKACCHAHPPHGTAFAVAGVRRPPA
jgi:L-fuculose-phosphate aldolase